MVGEVTNVEIALETTTFPDLPTVVISKLGSDPFM